mgnify:CR=1 FL=1
MTRFQQLIIALFLAFSLGLPVNSARAVLPDEVLDDPVLEGRARNLSTLLRCLVCQNQNIDESAASLARDLRLIVRERLVDGDTDDQVLEFVVDRYGEFVLLKPRLTPGTILLWFGPAGLIIIGSIGVFLFMRRRMAEAKAAGPVVLSKAEEQELEKLLKQ